MSNDFSTFRFMSRNNRYNSVASPNLCDKDKKTTIFHYNRENTIKGYV